VEIRAGFSENEKPFIMKKIFYKIFAVHKELGIEFEIWFKTIKKARKKRSELKTKGWSDIIIKVSQEDFNPYNKQEDDED